MIGQSIDGYVLFKMRDGFARGWFDAEISRHLSLSKSTVRLYRLSLHITAQDIKERRRKLDDISTIREA